jgi:hypothetical protein
VFVFFDLDPQRYFLKEGRREEGKETIATKAINDTSIAKKAINDTHPATTYRV